MKKPMSVLLIDDEPSILRLFKIILEKRGYEVFTAETCENGLELAKAILPNIIVLDFNTKSTMSGIEACQHLREYANTAATPIIVASGHDKTEMNIPPHIEMSLSAVLQKPIQFGQLIEAIQQALKEIPHI